MSDEQRVTAINDSPDEAVTERQPLATISTGSLGPDLSFGTRPRLLDLFCCEGGAGMGYHRAGFDVIGVDLFDDYTQRRYPFDSYRGDVFDVLNSLDLSEFAAIHASPPCQRYSITNAARGHDYPDLIEPTRAALEATGLPYVIENVVGAPLLDPIELCGCMFGLSAVDDDGVTLHLQRARLFESNLPLTAPGPHDHSDHEWVGGCYGGARRDKYEAKYVRKGGYVPPNKAVVEAYMGIDWMTWKGLHQAIPPAYTEHIGRQMLDLLSVGAGASFGRSLPDSGRTVTPPEASDDGS